MTPQAPMLRLRRRTSQAAIGACSPHGLRRSFVSSAFDAGADLIMVQALDGHASPSTTARYDRRPEDAKRAAQLVHVPYQGAEAPVKDRKTLRDTMPRPAQAERETGTRPARGVPNPCEIGEYAGRTGLSSFPSPRRVHLRPTVQAHLFQGGRII